MRYSRVITLDLDFFVKPVRTTANSLSQRPSNSMYKPWHKSEVRDFLENKLGLNSNTPLNAIFITKHDEIIPIIRKQLQRKNLARPFNLINIDAHSDLGLGGSAWSDLLANLLKLNFNRRFASKITAARLNEGNWVAFTAAFRWLKSYRLIQPSYAGDDLFPYYFPFNKNKIQLFQVDVSEQMPMQHSFASNTNVRFFRQLTSQEPVIKFTRETEVTAKIKLRKSDLIIICHSPLFIPTKADILIAVSQEYFKFR